jgi:hypothetical protein
MIKVELSYFQKLIILSCKTHFPLSENVHVVDFIFFIMERKAKGEKNMSVLLVICYCFCVIEENVLKT